MSRAATGTTTAEPVPDAFDPAGPLPTGTTVLEASAGTGKTHAIVGLAVRYVAEAGIDIADLLLVTFSRAATQELRERTRDRFVAVAAALAEPERAAAHDDELVRALAAAEPALRRQRLLAALAEFDAGTIATTHSFCQRMLDELGLAGDDDPGSRLVENVDEVVQTVADDLYLARYARTEPPFPLKAARALALAAVHDRHATLAPDGDGEAGERVAFATAVRAETERRKRLLGLRDFDDLLVVLHEVLADPVHGPAARARVRERFPVALVDEFQDTDPLQWEILRLAFHGASTLVLVGDPKQAIYAFRGAEVLSYLDAVAVADARHELTQNRRSDAGLLRALAHLHGGAALGHPAITVAAVEPTREWSRLTGPDERIVPLRLRCLPRTGAGPLGSSGFPQIGRVRERAAADLADDVVGLLESGVRLRDRAGVLRDLGPGDIAVLVRTRSQIEVVRAALDRVGVASVLAGGTSVFGTPSATHWLWVLRALEQPHRSDRVRLAACTPLLGVDAAELDRGGPELTGRISTLLREAARLFARAGFAAVFERLAAATELAPRLLAVRNGERELTDLRHLAQLLDQVALTDGLGLTALTRWLGDRVRDPASGSVADRSRRLDRDSTAVQIATVHASKGLEFPIVYLPFAWDSARNPKPATQLYHDGRTRVLDVGGPDVPGAAEAKRRAEAEESGQELRLLYVALTRAMCQVVAWWAPAWGTDSAPLHRMTLGRPDRGAEVPARAPVPADAAALAALTAWAAPADGAIAVSAPDGAAPAEPRRIRVEPHTGALAAAPFDRALDHQWRRTSYSALTAGAHEAAAAAETEPEDDRARPDEPAGTPVLDPDDPFATAAPAAAPSLMNTLPYGAEFGTLVHGVLELVDTGAADLAAEVRARCLTAVHAAASAADPDVLADALLAVLHTPLGLGRTLAEIPVSDRLSELDFELPLAGGERPAAAAASLPRIAALLARHLPADDVLAGYPAQLAQLDGGALRGYLTGSIDAVLRLPGPRFVVVDYKTNRLGLGDLTVAHYTGERMAAEMIRSHYPLQAVLYAVALHRFLRWRLPGYDPARHLGGVRYLFVRGMIGPETPDGAGVFDWAPPAALVTELSDLLAGEPG
ncbi:UvrD-helicase domain-containing protein [Nocardia jiangsuensis]|uniref:RecBCD enzyme subunit RecB n=1 Tax=Nocardia jiangsuensis TaxID=1691563 RepID=A0ABV8DSJ8_9NOCA